VERPPADPWAPETEVRPAGSEPPGAGPTGTGVLPTVGGAADAPEPRWSARAQVRPPGVADERHEAHEAHEEWAEPGRGPLVPVLIGVCIVLLLGLITLGVVLLLNNRDRPATNPPATTPAGQTSAAPSSPATTAATSAAPTSAAPIPVEIPVVEGLDYDTAAARLVAVGFVPNRVDENSTVPAGRVIGTNPPAGNTVLPGTKIDVRVSTGLPQPTTTRPPTSPAATSKTT
jgi:hypothetical protein